EVPAAPEPRRRQPLAGRDGREGDLPDLLQHPRLPPRANPRAPQDQDHRDQEPDGAGAGGDAAAAGAPPAPPLAAAQAARPLGGSRAPQEEIARVRAVDIIHKKRSGDPLSREEIAFFVEGYTRGAIPDYQAAALAMAVYFRGMTSEETVALTESMMRTGEVLDLSDLPGPRVDKHSTGGVGDKTSL